MTFLDRNLGLGQSGITTAVLNYIKEKFLGYTWQDGALLKNHPKVANPTINPNALPPSLRHLLPTKE